MRGERWILFRASGFHRLLLLELRVEDRLRRVLGVAEELAHEIEIQDGDPLHHVVLLGLVCVEDHLGRGEHNEPPVEDRGWGLHDKEVEIPFLVLVRLLVVLLRLDKELDSLC